MRLKAFFGIDPNGPEKRKIPTARDSTWRLPSRPSLRGLLWSFMVLTQACEAHIPTAAEKAAGFASATPIMPTNLCGEGAVPSKAVFKRFLQESGFLQAYHDGLPNAKCRRESPSPGWIQETLDQLYSECGLDGLIGSDYRPLKDTWGRFVGTYEQFIERFNKDGISYKLLREENFLEQHTRFTGYAETIIKSRQWKRETRYFQKNAPGCIKIEYDIVNNYRDDSLKLFEKYKSKTDASITYDDVLDKLNDFVNVVQAFWIRDGRYYSVRWGSDRLPHPGMPPKN